MDTEAAPGATMDGEILARLHAGFGALGGDSQANIGILTRTAGELLGADAAVYYRKRGGAMFAVARWGLPDDFNPLAPAAPACVDAVRDCGTQACNPSCAAFGTCVSRVATAADGSAVGLLCALYSLPRRLEPQLEILLELIAGAVGREERRLIDDRERRQLTETLRQATKMEVLALLVGGIAHDFNNCLTGICGNAELLHSRRDLPEDARARADEISQGGRYAAALTRQLLSFSRKQPLETVVMDLNAAVTTLHKLLRRTLGEHISISLDLEEGAGCLRADPGQIDQVILNLTVNARDAMPQGGRLTIKTRGEEVSAGTGPEALRAKPGRYLVLSVRDTGHGMTPEIRARLFEAFFTTKAVDRGTGLGLTTVQGIVSRCDGAIEIDTAPGRGTEFRVYFPALTGAAPEPAESLTQAIAPGASARGRVLLVEDEASVRTLLSRVLSGAGYEAVEAVDGAAALRLADERGPFDLVISDIVMPGMNGFEFARRQRARQSDARFLFISGYADEDTLKAASVCPNSAVLMKPFTPTEFVRLVRKSLAA